MTTEDPVHEQVAALRRELKLTWESHSREHEQHERAHNREHEFAQKAIDTAAILARESKADANEWRSAMGDREKRFSTKEDVEMVLKRLDNIERAGLVSTERERQRLIDDGEQKQESERRQTRQQWIVGIAVTVVVVLVNLAIRLAGQP